MEYPTNESGSFPYRAGQKNGYVFVDGIGLACPFLYRYGIVFGRQECKELAVRQIVNFLAYGMDTASALPYHGYDVSDGCKYGIIGWGRAVGWLLRGMTACLQDDYGAERLQNPFTDLVDAALTFQRRDGFFSWQLQAMEGPADTSATGMICAALQQGIRLGILTQEKYGQAFQNGKSALERSVKDGRVYRCSGECLDFAQYPQKYGAYPWALGPALEIL
jgi:rhamnogalacturonyl hydrolase YesR